MYTVCVPLGKERQRQHGLVRIGFVTSLIFIYREMESNSPFVCYHSRYKEYRSPKLAENTFVCIIKPP